MKRVLNLKIKFIVWAIISILIGVFLASTVVAFWLGEPVKPIDNQAAVIQLIAPEKTKEVTSSKYYYANTNMSNAGPKVAAESYIVGDLNTGEVILAKKQDEKLPIASVSKLMTALVSTQITDKNNTATVSSRALATLGNNGGFRLGEKIKTGDLLYPLLLESSNDAAEIIAEHFGRDNFISKMNQVAQELKMTSTSYADPSGLSAHNVSTVSDLFRLTGYLRNNNPEILAITDKRSYSNKKHSWSNINKFLGRDGYLGGKTGYTGPAKETIVSIFNLPLGQTGMRPIGIALLGSRDRYRDVTTIINYLKKNIYYGGLADATTNWVAERIAAPEIKDPNFVTMTFGGDIMLDRGVRNSVIKNFNNDYSALFEKLGLLKDSDITFANLEGTASNQGVDQKNLYSFRMDPDVVPALKGAGFTILSVANNHVGDWGRAAYVDSLANLRENEILYTGGGNNAAEAETPTIIEKYGMKIGFLGFSDKGPANLEVGPNKAGLLLASNPRFDEIISNAAKQVDYLVVSFHFGEEYQTKHNARQEYLAHKAVDDGAKLIIGAHPHVIEDTEVYKNAYIAYSLGNFIFDQAFSANTMQGMLLNVKLYNDGSLTVQKNIVKLNKAFKPDQVILGKEERVKFQIPKN